ncbi:acetyl-CoA synthetase-like protein [Microthyrium microscopicum]|uniref:Acetyl-CoA synthetase-like protein n=1 Tax=Microthyrium microscopicum TaxID=703497 RepID=A0A6A6TVX3_9PEZI|nr:acetyl-CoA synthetase-like protein [Microthyrium microscopicum]
MPVSSEFPAFEPPKVDIFNFMFERKEREYPDDKALYTDPETGRSYTYASVKAAATDFGKGLRAVWDWKKGDVVALYSPNCIDTPAIMWGTLWAGGVLSPANFAYTADELAFQLKDSNAKALVTQVDFLPVALKAAEIAGLDREFIILMGDKRLQDASFKHFTSIRNISGAIRYRKAKVVPEKDLAFLVYSSGTTGLPKGVMLTHQNITSNLLQLQASESNKLSWQGGPSGKGDRILAFLPFFHIYGLTCLIMQSCHRGFELVVMAQFELERFCQIVQEYKISFVYLVPPILLGLAKHPIVNKYDLSSLRMVNSGAAPLTKELILALQKRFELPVKQGYGLSETSPTTHVLPWDDWKSRMGSTGKLLPNLQAKYLDADGNELPVGETGELALKGPNVFKGYLNRPELTKDAFTPDGFFKTGDIGHEDKDGYFYITDRAKELIKYKGFQVAPAELEGLLIDHPKVDDAAVVGVYSEEHASELPRAYLVVKQGVAANEATAEEISSWLASKVAPHKKLRGGIRFKEAIPKSTSGKLLRRLLKDEAKREGAKAKL